MRSDASEQLDDLEASGPDHAQVLQELAMLNQALGTCEKAVHAIRLLAIPRPRIVDLGCASGDLLVALRAAFPDAQLTGVDGNQAALDLAGSRVDANLVRADILSPDFELPPCDVVVSTHFLYHLDDQAFLAFARAHLGIAIVVVELKRSRLSSLLFAHLLRPFLHRWTHADGLLALQRAFEPDELRRLLPGCALTVGPVEMVAVRPAV